MSEEFWICTKQLRKPIPRALGLMGERFELLARPADDIEIDPLQGRTQLSPIEVAVVGDPALNVRVVHLGQVLQGLVAAMMKSPPPDGLTDGLQRLWAGGGQEAVRVDVALPHRFSCSGIEAEKVERLVRKISTPVCILAVDDLRLVRMQHQLAGREAVGKRAP